MSEASKIVASVCNERRNSDLYAHDKGIINAFDAELTKLRDERDALAADNQQLRMWFSAALLGGPSFFGYKDKQGRSMAERTREWLAARDARIAAERTREIHKYFYGGAGRWPNLHESAIDWATERLESRYPEAFEEVKP